jgi:hypothetical protein
MVRGSGGDHATGFVDQQRARAAGANVNSQEGRFHQVSNVLVSVRHYYSKAK